MTFDYDENTRAHYQSDAVAEEYHAWYSGPASWRTITHRLVARRETAVVEELLSRVPHARALDVPCGTGKLGPVFARLGSEVVAADISPNMLRIAEREYGLAGVRRATFQTADATRLATDVGSTFDVAVCLRLLHRVPADLKDQVLRELASSARMVIASVGIESSFHRLRRRIRNSLFGGGTDPLCFEKLAAARERVSRHFVIEAERWVIPGASQELVFLLRSR